MNSYDVAIIGAGPTGVSAAIKLSQAGLSVLVIERSKEIGGVSAKYKRTSIHTFMTPAGWLIKGEDYAGLLSDKLSRSSADVWLCSQVLEADQHLNCLSVVRKGYGKVRVNFKKIIFACGSREKSRTERGGIYGSRPSRVYYTMNLLNLIGETADTPEFAAVLGEDLIAHSAATEISCHRSDALVTMVGDKGNRSNFFERLYFNFFGKNDWEAAEEMSINGFNQPTRLKFADKKMALDAVIIAGRLTPNSELLQSSGVLLNQKERLPLLDGFRTSHKDWYAAGNIMGGFNSAFRCYRYGAQCAAQLINDLAKK